VRVGGLVNKVMSTAFVCLLIASALGTLSGKVNAAMLDADCRPPTSILVSPAGQGKIAFQRSVDGSTEIAIINPDGSEIMVLSQNGNRPEWSPDGTKIAFVSQREHSQNIYIMNADGTGEVRITYSSDWDWGPLSWSPSGAKIAFARTPPFFTENPDIWVMNADGSQEVQLTTDPSDDWQPSWSPDGTKIAFVSYRGGYKDIWVMNADGSDPTNLINDRDWDFGDGEPAWSPDGGKIAFAADREKRGGQDIYVMDPDGSNMARLTTPIGQNHSPSWSPDGTRIAFASLRDGNYDIYIMNADGTNETRVTYDPANESGPSWGIAVDTGVIEECLVTIIDDPEADPATVESNGSAQLSVSVTDSLDHDIYYSWTATGGSFDNDESQNPTWYAPVNTSSSTVYYTLSVTARCSQGTTASGSVQVGVRAEEAAPAVSTYDASDVDLTSATLNGYLESTGGLDCLVWFEYGTSIFYERSTSRVSQSSEGPFSASISDLDPDTAYHFRACASNSEGTSYGSDVIFTQLTEEVRVGIDSCNVSPKELRLGEYSTLSFSFTNTGDTPWTFYTAVSLRQPNGAEVHLPLQPVSLDPNQQGSAAWSYTINYEGGWDVVFGIWKEQEQENSLGHTSWLNDYIICVQDDTNAPRVEFLSTQPSSITLGDSFTISYTVSDLGGSALNRVELWRANDSNGNPADWVEITRNSASGNSDSGFFTDAPLSAGFYWYGIHAVDNAGNWATEDSPVKVTVAIGQQLPESFQLPETITLDDVQISRLIQSLSDTVPGEDRFPLYVEVSLLDNDLKIVMVLTCPSKPEAAYKLVRIRTSPVTDTRDLHLSVLLPSSSPIECVIKYVHQEVANWLTNFGRQLAKGILISVATRVAGTALGLGVSSEAVSFAYSTLECLEEGYSTSLKGWKPGEDFLVYLPADIDLTIKVKRGFECYAATSPVLIWEYCPPLVRGAWSGLITHDLDEVHIAIEEVDFKLFKLYSDAELRVYDSLGRVTGLIHGKIDVEIPDSVYDAENEIVAIMSPADTYRCEVVGTAEGSYGLAAMHVGKGEVTRFAITEAPTSAQAVHEYTVDWDALAEGEKGVTMKIDSDGDGTFEDVRKLGSEGAGFSWVWIAVAGVSGLIGVFVGAFMVWRRIGKKQAA